MEQLILNLVPGGVSPVCYVSQYDVGRKIRLHLRNGSDPYVLSGAETVTATIRKVSGEELIYDIANTSASYVDMIVNYDATDVIGESVCELIITQSGTRIGSANFKMRIDPDVYSGDQKLEVVSATSETPDLLFETNVEENLLELKAGFSPVQDLHGYDSPWIDSNVVNKKPYLLRAIAGTASRIGTHEYNKIVGGTVAFNQIIPTANKDFTNTQTDTKTYLSIQIVSLQSPSQLYGMYNYTQAENTSVLLKPSTVTNGLRIKHNGSQVDMNLYRDDNVSLTANHVYIFNIDVESANPTTSGGIITKNLMILDLTAMFGSTIADYIYGLEQATAGAGVAWFKALFPNDYYAYNAGELMSVKATAHVMKNASNTVIGNYALDSNLELRGIPKLVNNKLEYYGDTYESDGSVTRKYGIVNLGSLNYTYDGVMSGVSRFNALLSDIKVDNVDVTSGLMCAYFMPNGSPIGGSGVDKTIAHYGNRIYINDNDYSDKDAFKTAMNGVYLVYELATPTTEQASPFTNPQVCDERGTEEYTDNRTVKIPVGHETYQANICPINGYSSANITRCGVNLFNGTWEIGHRWEGDGTYSSQSDKNAGTPDKMPCKPNTTYAFVMNNISQTTFMYLSEFDANKTHIQKGSGNAITTGTKYVTFTTGANTHYVAFSLYANTDFTSTEVSDIGVNYPSTDHTYRPAEIIKKNIQLGQTVYGGVLDVTRGKLHVTWVAVDLGDLTWTKIVNANGDFFKYEGNLPLISNPLNSKCSQYIIGNPYGLATDNIFYCFNSGANLIILVRDSRFSDANLFKTAMTTEQAKVSYELATPFDIDLTPVQIAALLGVNNVLHNGNGGTEVKFFRMISAS